MSAVEYLTPRPFGYVIGDEIRHEVHFTLEKEVKPQKASLPTAGKVNYWLDLKSISLEEVASGQYVLTLLYQSFYAPLSVKTLEVPGFEFALVGGSVQEKITVPAWTFTMSPLRDLTMSLKGGKHYLRSDALPPLISSSSARLWFTLSCVGALFALIYLAYYYGVWPFSHSKFRPFAHAHRSILALNKSSSSDTLKYKDATRLLHRAFDQTSGTPVFLERLPDFFAHHPQLQKLQSDTELFFNSSRRTFFSGQSNEASTVFPIERLQALSEDLRDAERRL